MRRQTQPCQFHGSCFRVQSGWGWGMWSDRKEKDGFKTAHSVPHAPPFYFRLNSVAGRILAPWPGIEPALPAVWICSLIKHWATREVHFGPWAFWSQEKQTWNNLGLEYIFFGSTPFFWDYNCSQWRFMVITNQPTNQWISARSVFIRMHFILASSDYNFGMRIFEVLSVFHLYTIFQNK